MSIKAFSEDRAAGAPPKLSPQLLFSSLDEKGLRAMIEIFDVRVVARGKVLVEEGSTGEEAFFVARGELHEATQGAAQVRFGQILAEASTGFRPAKRLARALLRVGRPSAKSLAFPQAYGFLPGTEGSGKWRKFKNLRWKRGMARARARLTSFV